MTKERAKELIPVIQAYAEGKTMQVRIAGDGDPWQDYTGECPNFENGNWEWRIKPEPREFWLFLSGINATVLNGSIYDNETDARMRLANTSFPAPGIIHVREVLD